VVLLNLMECSLWWL